MLTTQKLSYAVTVILLINLRYITNNEWFVKELVNKSYSMIV